MGIKADGRKIVNGNYSFNLNLTTNESGNRTTKVPVQLSVSGNNPSVDVPKVVDFGSILTGQSKTLTIEVFNKGYGSFQGSEYGASLYEDNISSSSENFSGPHSVNGGFPARATSKVDLTFNPKSAGSHSGTVTFTDKYGNEVKILLQGVATDPARLAVTPQVIEADTLSLGDGDPKEFTFKISNEGKYPLEYVFPKFSSESVDGGSKLHKFGYNIGSTLEGFNEFAYEAAPELINPTDIASKFDDATYLTNAIPLGFSFPFYGKSYDKIYITSFGGVLFAPNKETLRSPLSEESSALAGTLKRDTRLRTSIADVARFKGRIWHEGWQVCDQFQGCARARLRY